MTYLTIPNYTSSIKFALKSVPGLADVGVPHGDGDAEVLEGPPDEDEARTEVIFLIISRSRPRT